LCKCLYSCDYSRPFYTVNLLFFLIFFHQNSNIFIHRRLCFSLVTSVMVYRIVCLSICLSVHISRKPHSQTTPHCLMRLSPVPSVVEVCFVLPVLRMTVYNSTTVRTLIGRYTFPVNYNHWRVAAMTGSARHRLWHLLTSALNNSQVLLKFGYCLSFLARDVI